MEQTFHYQLKKTTVRLEDTVIRVLNEQFTVPSFNGHSLHIHQYAELFFCADEKFVIRTETDTVTAEPGNLVIVPKNTLHYADPAGSSRRLEAMGLIAEQTSAMENRPLFDRVNALLSGSGILVTRDGAPLYGLLSDLAAAEEDMDAVLCAARFLKALLQTPFTVCSASPQAEGVPFSDDLLRLDSIINSCFCEDLTAEDVAKMLYISERQLARTVQERYKTTLHRLFIKKRLEASAHLLTETSLPVDTIGLQVGFRSKTCFYRAFRESFGMTPNAYRSRPKQ